MSVDLSDPDADKPLDKVIEEASEEGILTHMCLYQEHRPDALFARRSPDRVGVIVLFRYFMLWPKC